MTGAGGGFRLDPARLEAVADRIAGIVAGVDRVRSPGAQVSGDAFGLVGGFFAGAATSAMRAGDAAVADLGRSLAEAADTLRAAVRDYELTDLDAARSFLEVEVPRTPSTGTGR